MVKLPALFNKVVQTSSVYHSEVHVRSAVDECEKNRPTSLLVCAEPIFVLGRMLLGKLDSDSDSDSAPPGYKPRRLNLSDLDVERKRVITAALLATKFANTPAASVLDNDDNFCSQKPALVVVHDCVLEQWMHVLRTWTHCSVVELCSNEKKLCRHIQKVQEGDYAIAICSYATLALRTHKARAPTY
eukprot:10315-Heterococcus_DN1.PRE.5